MTYTQEHHLRLGISPRFSPHLVRLIWRAKLDANVHNLDIFQEKQASLGMLEGAFVSSAPVYRETYKKKSTSSLSGPHTLQTVLNHLKKNGK